jgi:hypothetical protein
LVLYDL